MSRLVLRGVTWDHPRGRDGLVRCSEVYAAAHGVDVQWTARSLKDFGDAPIDRLAEVNDLLIIDHPHLGRAMAGGALAPLDAILPAATLRTLNAESAGPAHGSYECSGRQWALAVDAAMQTAAFRADLVGSTPPGNWPDVLTLARRLRVRRLWMALALVPTDAICLLITLCAGLGDTPGRRDDGRFVGRASGRRALKLLTDLADLAHPESAGWNPIALYEAMTARDDVAYCPAAFLYVNYARPGFRRRRLSFSDLPGRRGSCLGGAGIAVSARSAHLRAAARFAAWICGAGVQGTTYVQAQGQPGNGVAWRESRTHAWVRRAMKATLPTLEAAYVRPRSAGWPAFQEEAGRILHRWLRSPGRRAPDRILDDLDELHGRLSPSRRRPAFS